MIDDVAKKMTATGKLLDQGLERAVQGLWQLSRKNRPHFLCKPFQEQ